MKIDTLRLLFRKDIFLAFMMFSVVIVMIVPIHRTLMDALITLNMTLSILILMTSIYLTSPLGFATFPSVILLATTLRIALSVATTRLILTQADGGEIIRAFGKFAVSGNVVVGLIIFLIITIIQFVVITKGAERIAEVSARFKLDALPGQQMSIEADSKSGDMTREEVRVKRAVLSEESQYFGSMDGAMKFVKGDAIAGLIITAVNLIGGILVGMGQLDLSFDEAVRTFSLLTVGDGLVAQIPALFIALSAGTIVTRVGREKTTDLGSEIINDLFGQPQALLAAAAVVFAVGIIPGFPFLIFTAFSALLIAIYVFTRRTKREDLAEIGEGPGNNAAEADVRRQDRFSVACGKALFGAIDRVEFTRARIMREQAYRKVIGAPLPYFGVTMDPDLDPNRWEIRRDSIPTFFATTDPDSLFVTGDPNVAVLATEMEPTMAALPHHRVYRLPRSTASALKKAGIDSYSLATVIAEATSFVMAVNNGILFGLIELDEYFEKMSRRERQFLDQILNSTPRRKIVEIISNLLIEQVPIVPRSFFLDSLAYVANEDIDAFETAQSMRYLMRRHICGQYANDQNVVGTYIVDRDIDIIIRRSTPDPETGSRIPVDLNAMRIALDRLTEIQQANELTRHKPVLVASSEARAHLRGFLFRHKIYLPVLAQEELADEFVFEPLGIIGLE